MKDQTRRDLLVILGQTATASALFPLMARAADTPALPPGVYLPSSDHLGHALMSSERYHAIPPGCPTDYVRPATGPFEPQFFSKPDFAVIRRMVQLILGEPSDDTKSVHETAEWIDLYVASADGVRAAARKLTPLHRALAVAYHGVDRVERVATEDPAQTCRDGLAWMSHAAGTTYGKEFLKLPPPEQISFLQSFSDARADKQSENPGSKFFQLIKAETIKGFYTSQAGLKELDFKGNAFYARSPGCST